MAASTTIVLQQAPGLLRSPYHNTACHRMVSLLSPAVGNPRVPLMPPGHGTIAFSSLSRCQPIRRSSITTKALSGSEESAGTPAVLPSGEWPENFSILNFEDLSKHYESILFKEEAQPSTFLADVMSRTIYTARPDQNLEEIDNYFNQISGLPVIDDKLKCIGVLSKKDKIKASDGLKSKVKEVMSSPAITLSADKTVSDAAVLMLKHKIHRIPIVNGSSEVVGIVTRTDIFSALEGKLS